MGSRTLPFTSTMSHEWLEKPVMGEYKDKKDMFRWNILALNSPGDKNYGPNLPCIYK